MISRPLNIVLVEPEIPQNTGNIARTCACTGARLHEVDIVRWPCAAAFFEACDGEELHLFTGHASRSFADAAYGEGAYLVFGRESRGLDRELIDERAERCVRIPMRDGLRSLNLSNAVAVATYEALRQQGWPGLV